MWEPCWSSVANDAKQIEGGSPMTRDLRYWLALFAVFGVLATAAYVCRPQPKV